MRKINKLLTIINFIFILSLFAFFSCDLPIALGDRLDVYGPVVNITKPDARHIVGYPYEIVLEGNISDQTDIQSLIIKIEINKTNLARQYRWTKDIGWEITENGNADNPSWLPYADATWTGDEKYAEWTVDIDLKNIDGNPEPQDGVYVFSAQAWDTAGFSTDNSLKTRVFLIDSQAPNVRISQPYLYSRYLQYYQVNSPSFRIKTGYNDYVDSDELAELNRLHSILDSNVAERKNPANIGKFVTGNFDLRWQIEENNQIDSFKVYFYNANRYDDIDQNIATAPPSNWLYMHEEPSGAGLKTIGQVSITASDLSLISEKTTIMVVVVCIDKAGNVNQESIVGYFQYWPKADDPWITFIGSMESAGKTDSDMDLKNGVPGYHNMLTQSADPMIFMVYPSIKIKASAYHQEGVREVRYSLYNVPVTGTTLADRRIQTNADLGAPVQQETIQAVSRPNGGYSTVLSWEFSPPPRSGYYIVKAVAVSTKGRESPEYWSIYRMQDISFPSFVGQVYPSASEPLYKFIGRPNGHSEYPAAPAANSIRISGVVDDATEISNITMAWINPQSRDFAAMSQLAYFRDSTYQGWKDAVALNYGAGNSATRIEPDTVINGYPYDPDKPNRLWKIRPNRIGLNTDTNRIEYRFYVDIPLSELNIGLGVDQNRLKSQVFLIRIENPDGKCTVITYAPQGDEHVPEIEITNVVINRGAGGTQTIDDGHYEEIPIFSNNNTITINGKWKEESIQYLAVQTYFTPNFEVTINGDTRVPVTLTPASGTVANGALFYDWRASITVGEGAGQISAKKLIDTLVIAAKTADFGGNVAEAGKSWLIQSDNIRLMRISSENSDKTYTQGEEIRIFLEFNKLVMLTNSATTPVLRLNSSSTAYATYIKDDPAVNRTPSTRQYFRYIVGSNDNTTVANANVPADRLFLNVIGLQPSDTGWNAANYPFSWTTTSGLEEIRVTEQSAHNADGHQPSGTFYARRIPVTTTITDTVNYQRTLIASKHITIDTGAPIVESISANNETGYYRAGDDIYITVTFNKPVLAAAGTNIPRLTLNVRNGTTFTTRQTSNLDSDIRVNGNRITFVYKIQDGDYSANNANALNEITITDHTGRITDLAGNIFASNGITAFTGNKVLTGRYVEARPVGVPTVRLYTGASNTSPVVTNTVNNTVHTGNSTNANRTLSNLYNNDLWVSFEGSTNMNGTNVPQKHDYIEYSIRNGDAGTWVRVPAANKNNIPIKINQTGTYTLVARQVDMAGNVSDSNSPAITFTWDPGNIVSRLDSSNPNGIYSVNTNPGYVDITVHFRKDITITGSPTINVNSRVAPVNTFQLGTGTTTTVPGGSPNSLTFRYVIAEGENTDLLNVTALNINAIDTDGVALNNNHIFLPSAPNRFTDRKDISIKTGQPVVTGPNYLRSNSGDNEWAGTITINFDRPIQKGSGEIIIRQNRTGYRLPAVLTEAQAAKYSSLPDFNTFYKRGTNGFIPGAAATTGESDTTLKFILDYAVSANQTPAATRPGAAGIGRLAFDFHDAETIRLPVSSQDVLINPVGTPAGTGRMVITLADTNALQVLGAEYSLIIPEGAVVDNLGYRWPAIGTAEAVRTYTRTYEGINRPFARIDKRIDQDRITSQTGNINTPALAANYSNVLQARAKLDCRTPNSTIRYVISNNPHTADGNGLTDYGWTGTAWRNRVNGNTNANETNDPSIPVAGNITATGGTGVVTFTPGTSADILIGNDDYEGHTWRIRMISRGSSETINSTSYDEVAFKTVLTYVLATPTRNDLGQRMAPGDQIWIRGGDAISSSSTPGIPFTWKDDFGTGVTSLSTQQRRAGIRLMQRTAGTDLNTSTWKYVTWEINVNIYFDLMLGRGAGGPPYMTNNYWTSDGGTNQNANDAWQYGPLQWAAPRGGWAPAKTYYPLVPGKHRWLRHVTTGYNNGGALNWSPEMNGRATPAVTYTQPNP